MNRAKQSENFFPCVLNCLDRLIALCIPCQLDRQYHFRQVILPCLRSCHFGEHLCVIVHIKLRGLCSRADRLDNIQFIKTEHGRFQFLCGFCCIIQSVLPLCRIFQCLSPCLCSCQYGSQLIELVYQFNDMIHSLVNHRHKVIRQRRSRRTDTVFQIQCGSCRFVHRRCKVCSYSLTVVIQVLASFLEPFCDSLNRRPDSPVHSDSLYTGQELSGFHSGILEFACRSCQRREYRFDCNASRLCRTACQLFQRIIKTADKRHCVSCRHSCTVNVLINLAVHLRYIVNAFELCQP